MPDTTSRQTLKAWFSNGCRPNENHFAALIDSLYHRDDPIPLDRVHGLEELLFAQLDSAIGTLTDFAQCFNDELP